ncbi:MAG TPA: serine hydrolase domain-containing protein [Thermoanaerobaculia bacterium]|nr:serine hydrolase domain-containing protein [Thermoanaerobaculia bacterium]
MKLRNILRKLPPILSGVLLLAAAAAAQAPAVPRTEQARRMMEELRTRVGSPGLSAAVAVDGKIVWAEGFGEADVEGHVAVSPASRFRLGSISKLLTAASAARLVEQGRLDLDAPVQRYVPSYPDKGQPITPRQLGGHLAGIRHYGPQDFLRPVKRYEKLADGLEIFQGDPLVHAPGASYLYSSYGYNLLGVVVEGAAGKDFLTTVDELVLRPLGLTATGPDVPERVVDHRVRPYRRTSDGALENETPIDSSYKWPSGGFLSTASDVARFGAAQLAGDFLKPETRALLFTSQRTAAGEETGVGLGWRIGKSEAGRRFYHHGGAIEGGRAFILLLPEGQVTVVILTNLSGARFAEQDALKLAELFLSET